MGSDGESHAAHYKKIYVILLGLLAVSLIGPVIGEAMEMMWLTLITAFGIAFVKAWLVLKHFMHVDVERPFIHYALITGVGFMVLFFAGVSPDVMNHEGTNWENVAAKAEIARALAEAEAGGGHGTHGEAAAHGDEAAAHGDEADAHDDATEHKAPTH